MSHIRLSRILVVLALAIAVFVPVSAAAHIGFGVGFYGPIFPWGYYGYYGPYAYPYGPYGYYPPYAYGPYGYGYGYGRPVGEVKIKSPNSNAQIYINGALAGRAHDLKRIYLKPGTYTIEQRIGSDVQKERVYVVANRSLQIEFGKPGTPSPKPAPPPATRPGAGAVQPQPERPDADTIPPPPPPPPPAPVTPEEQRYAPEAQR